VFVMLRETVSCIILEIGFEPGGCDLRYCVCCVVNDERCPKVVVVKRTQLDPGPSFERCWNDDKRCLRG